MVSGPSSQHKPFWDEMQRHLELDEPAEVSRILGREHSISRSKEGTTCAFEMTEFIDNCCELCETLSSRKLKPAASPYVNDGSLSDSDWDVKGSLSAEASRVLMKVLWCDRLARPDLNKAISDLTRRLTCWSVADDKRLHRLMRYLYGSRKFTFKGYIGDPPELLCVCVVTLMPITVLHKMIYQIHKRYDHDVGRSAFMVATLMGKPQADVNCTQHDRGRHGVVGCRSIS